MANGLPLTDSESGFDKEYPWSGRDPRFYADITYDGLLVIENTAKFTSDQKEQQIQYANLYTGGNYRDVKNESRTGYLLHKFAPLSVNGFDENLRDYGDALTIQVSWMRLSDIYLMYAESVANGYGTPAAAAGGFTLTAVDAVNTIRERAGVGAVADKYAGSLDDFMSELRRERAVELAYEGHRFNDLRRWLLITEYPYTIKTSQEFDRVELDTEDPTRSRVADFREEVIVTRNFSEKHYWMPLKVSDVNIYPEFYQNPGW